MEIAKINSLKNKFLQKLVLAKIWTFKVVKMTNDYSRKVKAHNFTTDADEIRLFLGVLLLSGYNQLPRKHLYWEQQTDVFNEALSTAMPRNKFDQLFRFLHLCDNDSPRQNDRFWKLRPFYDLINKRCLKYRTNIETLSTYESMVSYFGRHPCRNLFLREFIFAILAKFAKFAKKSSHKIYQNLKICILLKNRYV